MNRAALLEDYLQQLKETVVSPGEADCALFVAGWLFGLQGSPLLDQWHGTYETFEEGYARLREAGFKNLRALAEHHLNALPSPLLSQPGDVALIEEAGKEAFGIIGSGGMIHVLHIRRGLDVVPIDHANLVFRP